jgi:glycine cleavage system T protein (aminomethyltransferase)
VSDAPIRSVLYDVQEALGATFVDYDGWLWTDSFGDHPKGYEAVRGGVVVWDVYPMVKWVVTGPDARAAIQRVFTRDLSTQRVGQVRYGPFVDPDGLMVDDGTVYKHAEDRYWVLVNSEGWGDHAREHSPDADFTATLSTHEMPLLSLQGPSSRALLQSLTDSDVSGLGYFSFAVERPTVAGIPTWVGRTGFSGEIGYELIPDRDRAVALWNALVAAGAVPMGLDTLEPMRIEAGLVVYTSEYEPGVHSPYDLSMDRLVALDSDADFVGRQRLAELAAAPPNRLKTVLVEGEDLPEAGTDLLLGGTAVGTLTSVTVSPQYGILGLARIATEHAADGTAVEIALGDGTIGAVVAPLSIKDPEKKIPRG